MRSVSGTVCGRSTIGLAFSASKTAHLGWVKNGNPVHVLHSAPLQFGAFEPLRWHPASRVFWNGDDWIQYLCCNSGNNGQGKGLLVVRVPFRHPNQGVFTCEGSLACRSLRRFVRKRCLCAYSVFVHWSRPRSCHSRVARALCMCVHVRSAVS